MKTPGGLDEQREGSEWQSQERARLAERNGAPADGDPAVAQYRLIARALRQPPLASLPSGFAARTAACAEGWSHVASERVEAWLERVLIALLVAAGIAVVAVYYGAPLRALTFALPEPMALSLQTLAGWGIAIAVCLGLSSAFELARKR